MKMKSALLTMGVAILIGGCTKSEETHDVAYYQNNPDALKEKWDQCTNNPGDLEKSANCINAAKARRVNTTQGRTTDYSDAFKGKP